MPSRNQFSKRQDWRKDFAAYRFEFDEEYKEHVTRRLTGAEQRALYVGLSPPYDS